MLVAVGLVLIMGQPDFGSFVVIVVITMGMLFLAGFPVEVFCRIGGDRCEWYGFVDFGRTLPYGACGGVFGPLE